MSHKFKEKFSDFACVGDSISTEVNGLTLTAVIMFDATSNPMELDEPGCCFDTSDKKYGKLNRRIIADWKRDEWFYCGVTVTVEANGVTLVEPYDVALWGIEANASWGRKKGRNRYLNEIANQLIDEALDAAKDKLTRLALVA